ncbi:MAG TPA: hypothetical protein VHB77_22605 [Planctomycetaceae bacterium]|nr:hypothetical protein [Planctomycetaceae bacterium]
MFDAYHKWLGIPPKDQPPNHYRLLGLELFESDADVIDAAANRQMTYVRGCATGPHAAISQKLLGEIAAARLCLLNAAKKSAYDATLQADRAPPPLPDVEPAPAELAPADEQPDVVDQEPISNEHLKAIVIKSAAWSAGALVCALALGYLLFPSVFGRRPSDKSLANATDNRPPENIVVTPIETTETEPSESATAPVEKPPKTKSVPKNEPPFAGTPAAGALTPPPPEAPAVVRVTGMKSTPLELASDWKNVPDFLRGAVVYSRSEGPIAQFGGLVDFEVLSAGVVFLAASWNIEGGPKSEPGAESSAELQRMGWHEAGEISLREGERSDRHLVFWRKCADGQRFKLRTRSTLPPFVLVCVDSGGRRPEEMVNTAATGNSVETVTINPTPSSQRSPVPNDEARRAAERQVKELFHDQLAVARKLKTPAAEKAAIAKKLFDQAVATRDDPAARYALFLEALDLTESAGDASGALKCVEEMERWFEVDGLALRMNTLSKTASGAKFTEPQLLIARTSLALVDEALLEGDYEGVNRLLRTAGSMATKAKDRDLSKRINDRKKEVQDAVREYEAYQASSQYLAKNANDPNSNLVTGRFLCFIRGDWSEGLARLKKAGDAAWKAAADAESQTPSEPSDQLALADAWWTVAQGSESPWKQRIQSHAGAWYSEAAAGLNGLDKTRAEKRVQESGYDPQSKVVAEDTHNGTASIRPRTNIYTLRALQPIDVRNSVLRFQGPNRDTDSVGNILVSLDGQTWQPVANWNAASCARAVSHDGWQTVALRQIPAGARVRELHVRFDYLSGRTLSIRKATWSKR